jgi:hypothetical protein
MGIQRSQFQNDWPHAFLFAFYMRRGFRNRFDHVAELITHVAEQLADHAAMDKDHRVIGAVGDGGAGELGEEQHLVADVADVGEQVFGQQVAIRDEQMVGEVIHGLYSIGLVTPRIARGVRGLLVRRLSLMGEGIANFLAQAEESPTYGAS